MPCSMDQEKFGVVLGPLKGKNPDRIVSRLFCLFDKIGIDCCNIVMISVSPKEGQAKVQLQSKSLEDYAVKIFKDTRAVMDQYDLRLITEKPKHLKACRIEDRTKTKKSSQCEGNSGEDGDTSLSCSSLPSTLKRRSGNSGEQKKYSYDSASTTRASKSGRNSKSFWQQKETPEGVNTSDTSDSTPSLTRFQKLLEEDDDEDFDDDKNEAVTKDCNKQGCPDSSASSSSNQRCSSTCPISGKRSKASSESSDDSKSKCDDDPCPNKKVSECPEGKAGRFSSQSPVRKGCMRSANKSPLCPELNCSMSGPVRYASVKLRSGRLDDVGCCFVDMNTDCSEDSDTDSGGSACSGGPRSSCGAGATSVANGGKRRGSVRKASFASDPELSCDGADACSDGARKSSGKVSPRRNSRSSGSRCVQLANANTVTDPEGPCFSSCGPSFYHCGQKLQPMDGENVYLDSGNVVLDDLRSFRSMLGPHVCAFLNSGGGSLYFGVNPSDGSVVGFPVTHKFEDAIRLDIDRQVQLIDPLVPPSAYKVNFVKVMSENGHLMPDKRVLVIEVTAPRRSARPSCNSIRLSGASRASSPPLCKRDFSFKDVRYMWYNGGLKVSKSKRGSR